MKTNRLEAFSDGVLAILITIMVLELRTPEGSSLESFRETTLSGLLTYLLSFVYIGIYWNNHHHLFQLTERITGGVLWANLHLLFWLSLIPFTTAWMDESAFAQTPVVLYGLNLLLAAIAYEVLQIAILRGSPANANLKSALGVDLKGRISPLLYLAGIVCGLLAQKTDGFGTWFAIGFFVLVALIWLIPDRRIESTYRSEASDPS